MTVLEHPLQALAKMLNPDHWFSVGILVGLPLLFALFSWRSLLLLAVSPLYFLMNDGQFILPFHAYFHQYAFVAGYIGLVLFLARHDISTRIGTTVIISVLLVNFLCSISSFGIYSGLWTGRDKAYKTQVEAFAKIPRDAGVYGPHRFSEFLSNRQVMIMGDMHDEDFDLDRVINAKYNVTHVLPGQIDYIVCDVLSDQCGWRKNGYNPDYTKIRGKNLDRLILSGKWKLIFDEEGVVILHRVGS
jgi:hypothetical protein